MSPVGVDPWIAKGCFAEAEWVGPLEVLGKPPFGTDPRFSTQAAKSAHQDERDELIWR